MMEQLTATVQWTHKLHFEGETEFPASVPIDYPPPLSDNQGHKPMELVLMSLASCSGQTVISLLQKMKQDVRAFSVKAVGNRKAEHPKVYTDIHLEFVVEGSNLDSESVQKAVQFSEEKYCPVWAMLKQVANVTSAVILDPGPTQEPVS